MIITGLGLAPIGFTAGGLPACDTPIVKKLAGPAPSKGKFGLAYEHYKSLGDEETGIAMSVALEHWCNLKAIETLLATYINPLQVAAEN